MLFSALCARKISRSTLYTLQYGLELKECSKVFAKKFGGDDEFVEKVAEYFAGTLMEARRYLEPEAKKKPEDGDEDDCESSEGESADRP